MDGIVGSITMFSHLIKVGNALVDVRDKVKLNELKIEFTDSVISLQDVVLKTQTEAVNMNNKIIEQQREIERLSAILDEREKFELRKIDAGIFCYTEKGTQERVQDMRKLCVNCFSKGKVATLTQVMSERPPHLVYSLECNECGWHYEVLNRFAI